MDKLSREPDLRIEAVNIIPVELEQFLRLILRLLNLTSTEIEYILYWVGSDSRRLPLNVAGSGETLLWWSARQSIRYLPSARWATLLGKRDPRVIDEIDRSLEGYEQLTEKMQRLASPSVFCSRWNRRLLLAERGASGWAAKSSAPNSRRKKRLSGKGVLRRYLFTVARGCSKHVEHSSCAADDFSGCVELAPRGHKASGPGWETTLRPEVRKRRTAA